MSIESIQVRTCMDESIVPLTTSTPLTEATKSLCRFHMTGLPVVDERNQVVGFLSEQDCLGVILNESFYGDTDSTVGKIMVTEVTTISPGTSIIDLAERMHKSRPRIFPVTENGKLVGVITRSDILTALKKHMASKRKEGELESTATILT